MDMACKQTTKSIEINALIDVAIEGWRFARAYARLVEKLDLNEAQRYANQARYFIKKIDDSLKSLGISLVSIDGHSYDPGMAVSALNLVDFASEDALVIEQMIEPIVMGHQGVVRSGTVLLAKAVR